MRLLYEHIHFLGSLLKWYSESVAALTDNWQPSSCVGSKTPCYIRDNKLLYLLTGTCWPCVCISYRRILWYCGLQNIYAYVSADWRWVRRAGKPCLSEQLGTCKKAIKAKIFNHFQAGCPVNCMHGGKELYWLTAGGRDWRGWECCLMQDAGCVPYTVHSSLGPITVIRNLSCQATHCHLYTLEILHWVVLSQARAFKSLMRVCFCEVKFLLCCFVKLRVCWVSTWQSNEISCFFCLFFCNRNFGIRIIVPGCVPPTKVRTIVSGCPLLLVVTRCFFSWRTAPLWDCLHRIPWK